MTTQPRRMKIHLTGATQYNQRRKFENQFSKIMKKILFVAAISLGSLAVSAQSYESVKVMVQLMQYDKAKVDLDKGMSNTKFSGKPEAYILKATTYGGLAMSDSK